MSKLALAPGVSLPASQRRLAPGYMQPLIVGDGAAGGTSLRAQATATASGTPHTKGSWQEIIAATTSDVTFLWLTLTASTFTAATDTSTLLDIGIGAAASEVVVVPNLAVGYQSAVSATVTPLYGIPVFIPVGSRVAIRAQSAVASKTVAAQVVLGQMPNGKRSPVSIEAIGADTASSHGVTLGAPAGTNTKGAWTQIVAATSQPYEALIFGVQGGSDTTLISGGALLDIGFGGSGAEVALAPDLPLAANSSEYYSYGVPPIIPCRIPAGTRLAARYQTAGATTGMDVILYGVRPA